jgi:adenylate cyclase
MFEQPERQTEIIELVEENFGQDKAVLILDLSGFCRTTHQHGIVLTLAIIHKTQKLLKPCIETFGGHLIKTEADNLYCLFDTVFDAVKASREMQNLLPEINREISGVCDVNVSIGIGYGHILSIENKDLFGSEVNFASRLGEDIAGRGEILLTENALAQLRKTGLPIAAESIELSGISLRYHPIGEEF